MNKNFRFVLVVFALASVMLGACTGAGSAPTSASVKVEAVPVSYTGVIESINGTQWTVNGQAIVVDPTVIRDGPFKIGDTVKIEAIVNQDGSVVVTRVELPDQSDLISLPQFGNDNSNDANSNDTNSNDDNSNGANSNDDNSNNANSNDDNSNNANSNDDNSNNANGNDDNSNGTNSNDDHGGGSSGGNDNGGGGDDSGGGDDGGGSGGSGG